MNLFFWILQKSKDQNPVKIAIFTIQTALTILDGLTGLIGLFDDENRRIIWFFILCLETPKRLIDLIFGFIKVGAGNIQIMRYAWFFIIDTHERCLFVQEYKAVWIY